MKKLLLISVSGAFLGFASEDNNKIKKVDLEAGKAKAVVCTACHGPDGKGVNPEWPKIAGQHKNYLEKQLKEFKSNTRKDPVMAGQVAALSDEDISNISAYFESIETSYGIAGVIEDKEKSEELLKLGESLYKGGDLENKITACTACHGPSGAGISPSAYPAIAGQYSKYTSNQLKAFRLASNADKQSSDIDVNTLKTRENDPNKMMRDVTNKLSDKDIEALSYYIQGLRP